MVDAHSARTLSDGSPSISAAATDSDRRDDGIAWQAARIILTRLVAEPTYGKLDPGLRLTIERFLERHPAMPPPPD
jgi:hypothetical protein